MKHFFKTKQAAVLLSLFYCAVLLVVCRYAHKNVQHDFDLVFYTACAIERTDITQAELHKQTYEILKRDLSSEKFKQITDSGNMYRHLIHQSPENFRSQLPLYRIKVFYVSMLTMAHWAGFSPVCSSTWINLICYLIIGAVLPVFLYNRIGSLRSIILSLCVMLLPFVTGTSKSSSPDMLAAVLALVALMLLITGRNQNKFWAVPVFSLLIFTRPENLIFVLSFCGLCLLYKSADFPKKYVLSLASFSILSYVAVVLIAQPYPWSLLYRHSFMGYIPDLQNAATSISIKEYFLGLRYLPNSMFYSDFFLMILLLVYPLLDANIYKTKEAILSYSILGSLIIRILLMPDLTNRFFTGYFIIAIVLFFIIIEQRKIQIADAK